VTLDFGNIQGFRGGAKICV